MLITRIQPVDQMVKTLPINNNHNGLQGSVGQVDMLRLDRGSIQDSALCGSYLLYLVQ